MEPYLCKCIEGSCRELFLYNLSPQSLPSFPATQMFLAELRREYSTCFGLCRPSLGTNCPVPQELGGWSCQQQLTLCPVTLMGTEQWRKIEIPLPYYPCTWNPGIQSSQTRREGSCQGPRKENEWGSCRLPTAPLWLPHTDSLSPLVLPMTVYPWGQVV